MSARVAQLLKRLYTVSETPDTTFSCLGHEITDSIDFVAESFAKTAHHAQADKHDIEEIVTFFLCLIHTSKSRKYESSIDYTPDIKGLLHIQECIRYLVSSSLADARSTPDDQLLITDVLEEWFVALSRAVPQHHHVFTQVPELEDPPLIALHYYTFKYSETDSNHERSLYRQYAFKIYKALRVLEMSDLKTGTFRDYLRSIRYFYYYVPDLIKTLPRHPEGLPAQYIDEAIDAYNADNPRSQMGPEYRRMLISIIRRREARGRQTHDRANNSYLATDGVINIINSVDGNPDMPADLTHEDLIVETDDDSSQSNEYEFSGLSGFVMRHRDQTVLPYKPTLKKNWQSLIHLRSFHFYWDSSFANLFHYTLMYRLMALVWGENSFGDALCTFLFILMHTGLDCGKLIDLRRADIDGVSPDSLALVKIRARYYIANPSLIRPKETRQFDHCHRTSDIVYVPMPDTICSMIDRLPSAEYIFSNANETGTARLSLDNVEHHLATAFKSGPGAFNLGYHADISTILLGNSFMPLYSGRFGLDPIICCHISGRDSHHAYKSSMHYVFVPHDQLEREYLRAFDRVHNAIVENMRDCLAREYMRQLPDSFSWIFSNTTVEQGSFDFGYGSSIIPHDDYLRSYISAIKTAVSLPHCPIERFNLFVVYSYLGLQFSSALRPRNEPDIDQSDINLLLRSVVVCDKESSHFHEERVLPLPIRVITQLQNLRNAYGKLQLHIAKSLDPQIMKSCLNKVFFFINAKGEVENFTLPKMREVLSSAGIDTDLPSNMPRHFNRTFSYRAGVCNSLASAILGHQHAGQESLNISSSAIPSLFQRESSGLIEQLLDTIGYTAIEYNL